MQSVPGTKDVPRSGEVRAAFVLVFLGAVSFSLYLAVNVLLPTSPNELALEPTAVLLGRLPVWLAAAAFPLLRSSAEISAVKVAAAGLPPRMLRAGSGYGSAILRCPRKLLAIVASSAIVFWLTSVLAAPDASGDLYLYRAHERVWNLHGAHPYLVPTAVFGDDPILLFTDPNWVQFGSLYGPTWTILSIFVGHLVGEDIVSDLLAFRLVLFGCGLASLVLIWAILGGLNPDRRLFGITL